jgi:ribosomal protein RSM22 (predicted rRNA methylase)
MTAHAVFPPPQSLLDAVERVARDQFDDAELAPARLARAVRRVSDAYTRIEGTPDALSGDREALCARLNFFLPRDFPKVQAPLAELERVAAFPSAPVLRVLDLGAGLGATSLSAAEFALRQPGIGRVEIDALDRDAAALGLCAQVAGQFARAAGLDLALRVHCAPLSKPLPAALAGPYHLIVLGFVLNELGEARANAVEDHFAALHRLAALLTPDGAIVVLEPALRSQSRALQRVRSLFAERGGPPYVFAPCLHRGACPLLERERDWCHEQLPLSLPPQLAALASGAGLRTEQLSYSYLTLHRADRSLAELAPSGHAYRVVSAGLRSKGKLELLVCGAGPARRLQRLDRHAGEGNRALDSAGRGSVVELLTAPLPDGSLAKVRADTRVQPLWTFNAAETDEPAQVC